MTPRIVREPLTPEENQAFADEILGGMIKVVVDLRRGILTAGMIQHAEGEQQLLQDGSRLDDLWGASHFPGKSNAEQIEYGSMINQCRATNRGRRVIGDPAIRAQVRAVIARYFPVSAP